MACGVCSIQTNYGGQTDYLKHGRNGWIISYDLEEVTHNPLYEGIKWATPHLDELKRTMRAAYEQPDKIKVMSANALEDSKKWTWANTAEKATAALQKLK